VCARGIDGGKQRADSPSNVRPDGSLIIKTVNSRGWKTLSS
jgi:hypothetical protein